MCPEARTVYPKSSFQHRQLGFFPPPRRCEAQGGLPLLQHSSRRRAGGGLVEFYWEWTLPSLRILVTWESFETYVCVWERERERERVFVYLFNYFFNLFIYLFIYSSRNWVNFVPNEVNEWVRFASVTGRIRLGQIRSCMRGLSWCVFAWPRAKAAPFPHTQANK